MLGMTMRAPVPNASPPPLMQPLLGGAASELIGAEAMMLDE